MAVVCFGMQVEVGVMGLSKQRVGPFLLRSLSRIPASAARIRTGAAQPKIAVRASSPGTWDIALFIIMQPDLVGCR